MKSTARFAACFAATLTLIGCGADSAVSARSGIVSFTTAGMLAADGQRVFRTVTKFPSNGPWGVALRADGLGLVTHPSLNLLSVIDAARPSIVGVVPVGACPSAVAFSPDGRTAYVAHSCDITVGVVDVDNRVLRTTITLPSETPQSLAVSVDGRTLYVGTTSSSVEIVDTQTLQITGTLRSSVFGSYGSLLLDPSGTTLYASTSSQYVTEFDLTTNTERRQLLLGGATQGIALSAARDHLIVANDGGYVSDVILASGFFLNTPTVFGSYDAVGVPIIKKTILTIPAQGAIASYDEVNHVIFETMPIGGSPRRAALHLKSKTVVVTDAAGFILFIR